MIKLLANPVAVYNCQLLSDTVPLSVLYSLWFSGAHLKALPPSVLYHYSTKSDHKRGCTDSTQVLSIMSS